MNHPARPWPTPARSAPALVWLALGLAMAWLPLLSPGAAWRVGEAALVEVCTSQGSQWVAPEAAAEPSGDGHAPGPASGHGKHCALCLHHLGHASLPAAAPAWRLELLPTEPARPLPGQVVLPARPLWSDAPPRAPPVRA